jgi:hypothetical protein
MRFQRYAWISTLFLTIAGLYGALAMYARQSGGVMTFPAASEWSSVLSILFSPPFELVQIAPWWSALYVFYFFCPWILTVLGTIGLLRKWKQTGSTLWLLPIASGAGIVTASILSAATLRYRNIIGHEQFEFALRLISLLPWVMVPGLIPLTKYVRRVPEIVALALLTVVITSNWHVSYPQLNPVMHVFSPGVSRTDELTVEAIEKLATGQTYVALVPQLTSAAALRHIGFERSVPSEDGNIYPYAIPTGGTLYRHYLELFEGRDIAETIEDTRRYASTSLLFIAVPIAWDDGQLDIALKKIAKERLFIDGSMQLYLIDIP